MVGFITEVKEDEVMPIHTDPTIASKTVLVHIKRLESFRPQMEKYPDDSAAQLGRLNDLAMAMAHVDAMYNAVYRKRGPLQQRYERGLMLRDLMAGSISVAVKGGLIDGDPLGSLTSATGYANVARDLLLERSIIRDHQAALAGKTIITEELLVEAESLAGFLLRVDRANEPKDDDEEKLLRGRTFTRLYQAWEAVRRTVQHIRYPHGDADELAPNLFAQDTTPKRKKDPEPEPPVPPSNGAPVPPSNGPNAPTTAPGFGSHEIPLGLPGSSPFVKG